MIIALPLFYGEDAVGFKELKSIKNSGFASIQMGPEPWKTSCYSVAYCPGPCISIGLKCHVQMKTLCA